MNFPTFLCTCFLFTICVYQATAQEIDVDLARQDEDSDNEPAETVRPALTPLLVNLFASVVGLNDSQANRSVNRWVQQHNGIDPDATTPTTLYPPPTTVPTTEKVTEKIGEEEEEEDEDEEDSRRRDAGTRQKRV